MKCYDKHASCAELCVNKTCRQWIKSPDNQNCTIIAARKGPMSLQQIGDILGVTRMRICQIEKKVVEKLISFI